MAPALHRRARFGVSERSLNMRDSSVGVGDHSHPSPIDTPASRGLQAHAGKE